MCLKGNGQGQIQALIVTYSKPHDFSFQFNFNVARSFVVPQGTNLQQERKSRVI